MELSTIGKNIRKYRLERKLKQEDLAKMVYVSYNYISVLERGDKAPSLQTLINIANALEVSTDMLLADVVKNGYVVKNSVLNDKLAELSPKDRDKIYEILDLLIEQTKR